VAYFRKLVSIWKEDNLLRRVVKNSGYLFSSSTLAIPLGAVQSIFSARLLGAANFGLLGIVTSFVTNLNRLFSFRMGEPVVRYLGESVALQKKERAAAVVKAAAMTEILTSLAAYLVLFLIAPLAARYIAKDPLAVSLIYLYGLLLIANLIPETSAAVLQVGNHYRSQAAINLASSMVTAIIIFWAFIINGNIWLVVGAYLLGKVIYGVGMTSYAFYQLRKMLGPAWWKVSLKHLPERRGFWKFAISTNLSGTITLLTRDSEELWLGYFLNTTAAGYYKTAKAVVSLVLTPITPFINTTYPEITKAAAQRAWSRLTGLLKRLTFLSGLWTAGVSLFLVVLGGWLFPTFYGPAFSPSYPVALLLLIGYCVANILFWNRTLLLSLDLPDYALKVTAITGLVKILLSFWLVPHFGYLAAACLLSAYLVFSVGLSVIRGLKGIRSFEKQQGTQITV
jgi:O-antigen/teichoic acid export membrane protein